MCKTAAGCECPSDPSLEIIQPLYTHAIMITALSLSPCVLIIPCSAAEMSSRRLELLVFMEEHAEADDGSVNQQTTNYGHDHGFNLDEVRVRENNREG